MFGDNRFGQLGLPATDGLFSTPQLQQDFLVYDWAQIYAGSRQTMWTSRASMCSGNCHGHGICNHDTGRCTCEEPWTYELDCLTAWCRETARERDGERERKGVAVGWGG